MKTKRLFNDDDSWSHEASSLDNKIQDACEKLFEEMIDKGYSIRDISHVMHFSITDLELKSSLDRTDRRKKVPMYDDSKCSSATSEHYKSCA